jgi:hypothetical protein
LRNQLQLPVDMVCPFASIGKAIGRMEANKHLGKIVVMLSCVGAQPTLLMRPWPPVVKIPKPSRIVMARYLGQLELFPLDKPKPAAIQLPLPLSGGHRCGLLPRPEVEKRAE